MNNNPIQVTTKQQFSFKIQVDDMTYDFKIVADSLEDAKTKLINQLQVVIEEVKKMK